MWVGPMTRGKVLRSTTWLNDFIFEFFYGPLKTPDIFREFGMKSDKGSTGMIT